MTEVPDPHEDLNGDENNQDPQRNRYAGLDGGTESRSPQESVLGALDGLEEVATKLERFVRDWTQSLPGRTAKNGAEMAQDKARLDAFVQDHATGFIEQLRPDVNERLRQIADLTPPSDNFEYTDIVTGVHLALDTTGTVIRDVATTLSQIPDTFTASDEAAAAAYDKLGATTNPSRDRIAGTSEYRLLYDSFNPESTGSAHPGLLAARADMAHIGEALKMISTAARVIRESCTALRGRVEPGI